MCLHLIFGDLLNALYAWIMLFIYFKTRNQENNSAQDRQWNHQEEDQTATTPSLEVSKY